MTLISRIRARNARLCELLGIAVPVIASPMVGVTTPEMVAAVSNAGGLGVMPCGFMTAEDIVSTAGLIRAQTQKPFALNLRVEPRVAENPAQTQTVFEALEPLREELGVEHKLGVVPDFEEQFEGVLEAVRASGVSVVSFSFGGPREIYAEKLEALDVVMMGAVNTTREAKVQKVAGCQVVIAQGSEAGGPRQYFENEREASRIGLMALLPSVARVCGDDVSVVAAGGMMSAEAMLAAMTLGAAGAQVGSLLVRSPESAWVQGLKDQVPWCTDASTVLSDMLTGRETRLVETGLIEALRGAELPVSAYPGQVKALSQVMAGALQVGRAELMEMPLGQAGYLAQAQPTKDIIASLIADFNALLGE